jgi:hypothetical protein
MRLSLPEATHRLRSTADAIRALARAADDEQARWKPAPERWSVLEIINHLADEEIEDFRIRLRLLLDDPAQDWPPIDPEGWVSARGYNQRDPAASLEEFLRRRRDSVAWLGTLDSVDWSLTHQHPRAGPLSAGALLGSWLAHDLLHIRQLARLHYQYLEARVRPHSIVYAGNW